MIDSCVNIICLYLQYSFASDVYNKYCLGLDCCYKKLITRSMTKSVSSMMENKYGTVDGMRNESSSSSEFEPVHNGVSTKENGVSSDFAIQSEQLLDDDETTSDGNKISDISSDAPKRSDRYKRIPSSSDADGLETKH